MIILLSSYSLNESSKFRMVFRSASLLQHPFPDVWRTVQNRDPCRLTRVQKTNTFDIPQIEFPQVQRDACSATLDLRLQLIKVLRSKLPAQTNPSAALVSNLSDLQRHGPCSEEQPNKCTPSFKIATICDSVNLDFLMTYAPYRESLLFTCIRAGGAYDHDTATPLPRDQSSQAAVMERRTKTSSRAIPGEAASLSERRASKASFSARRRASDSMLMITKSPEREPLIPQ